MNRLARAVEAASGEFEAASEAMDVIAREMARQKLDAALSLSEDEADLVDQVMQENPDWGYLDALAWLEKQGPSSVV